MVTAIVEMNLIGVLKDGTEISVQVRIDVPVQKSSGEWACRVVLNGVQENLRPSISGNDAFQSLCLAVDFVRFMLDDFLQKGGQLLYPASRETWPLEAYRMEMETQQFISSMEAADIRIQRNQEEIDRLKMETRAILTQLKAR